MALIPTYAQIGIAAPSAIAESHPPLLPESDPGGRIGRFLSMPKGSAGPMA
jgi:hypothetical protein